MKLKFFTLYILCLMLLLSSSALAKKAGPAQSKDSEWDPYGETCAATGKCTYTRREVLPGSIKAEIQIVSLGAFKGDVEKVFDYAFGDVRRIAGLFNISDPSSEISLVNANAGIGFVEVGPEFIQLLTASKKAFLWTDGTFDITTTPDIGKFNNIKISGNKVFLKKKGMQISFNNIIHGYIADLLIRAVYNANIDNALAEVGPTTRSIGTSVTGSWRTQIDDSEGKFARRGMTVDTSNISVGHVTANNNAPTIDPRWGIPLEKTCRSVTIISRNAAVSEALAHGIYILGPVKGMQLIERLQTIKGIIVDNNGNFIKSPGI